MKKFILIALCSPLIVAIMIHQMARIYVPKIYGSIRWRVKIHAWIMRNLIAHTRRILCNSARVAWFGLWTVPSYYLVAPQVTTEAAWNVWEAACHDWRNYGLCVRWTFTASYLEKAEMHLSVMRSRLPEMT